MTRILLVDDNAALAHDLAEIFALAGMEAVVAGDVTSAERLLETQDFDGILTDMLLPDGDGVAVLARACSATPPVPSYVMTAYAHTDTVDRALATGAAFVFGKPSEPARLVDVFARLAPSRSAVVVAGGPRPARLKWVQALLEATSHAVLAAPTVEHARRYGARLCLSTILVPTDDPGPLRTPGPVRVPPARTVPLEPPPVAAVTAMLPPL